MGSSSEGNRNNLKQLVESAKVRPRDNIREKRKSGLEWHEVMKEGGGNLAAFTSEVYSRIEEYRGSTWKEAYASVRARTADFEMTTGGVASNSGGLVDGGFLSLVAFKKQFPYTHMDALEKAPWQVHIAEDMRRPLLGAAALLEQMTLAAMKDAPIDSGEFSGTSLDVHSSRGITYDNIQTIIDVTSFLSRFVQTPQELLQLLPRLLRVCPNDEVRWYGETHSVNPRGYTYLELFALAPFGFWAGPMRTRTPETIDGKRIIRPDDAERLVHPTFVYLISRGRVPDHVADRKSRHGGCPALHPALAKFNLINRLGSLYARALDEFLKSDAPANSASKG